MLSKPKGTIHVYHNRAKPPADAIVIDCTSWSKEPWSRAFSPFYLGPVEVTPYDETLVSQNMENAWQFSKVFSGYEDKEKYLEWAKKGFDSKKAIRYPIARGTHSLYHVHKGEKLNKVEARKKIYCPLYAYCVEKYAKDALDKLRDLYLEGKNIALLDFDGYSKYTSLKEVLNDPNKKMGQAFVLAMIILNQRYWEDTK